MDYKRLLDAEEKWKRNSTKRMKAKDKRLRKQIYDSSINQSIDDMISNLNLLLKKRQTSFSLLQDLVNSGYVYGFGLTVARTILHRRFCTQTQLDYLMININFDTIKNENQNPNQ